MSKESKPEPLDKAALIQIIENKLRDPNCSPRDMAQLTRKLSLLKGWEHPNEKKWVSIADQQKQQQQESQDPGELPKWWNASWCEVFLVERLTGIRSGEHFAKALTQYWEGLSDEEKHALEARARDLEQLHREQMLHHEVIQ